MREIKFIFWNPHQKVMLDDHDGWTEDIGINYALECSAGYGYIALQFTGHKIKGVDLFEGDIVRLEENDDGVDPLDKMTWYVVVWIKEWSMFSLLRAKDEYPEYMAGNVDDLDTTMFWTFPLDIEDIDQSKHYLCGNIYQNPELLSPNPSIEGDKK